MNNICTLTDSYKLTHHHQYPDGTSKVYSYFEARPGARFPETVFFGLQALLIKYLRGQVVSPRKIKQAEELAAAHFGNPDIFDATRWEHILKKYGGRLPVRIKAVPEGTPVSIDNVMMTVENTDPECYWLTNHLETLLCHVWYPSTVATLSRHVKGMCRFYLDKTTDNHDGLDFMLHDFGFRGVSSVESAGIGGAGHLVNFMGTDTIAAIEMIQQYYNSGGDAAQHMPAFSIPATEHSVMTARGEEGEMEVVEQLLNRYPKGLLSIVIDSYDYKNFITQVAKQFGDRILKRDGKIVFRPDSGEPVATTLDVMTRLGVAFGTTTNSKKYKVLNPRVGCIWGDGIDADGIEAILRELKKFFWSAENMVFGMGGGLLQKVNRDTQRFAFKSSYQERNGKGYDIFKDPIDRSKVSKKGRLGLYRVSGAHGRGWTTKPEGELPDNKLVTVFEDGEITKVYNWAEVRANANKEHAPVEEGAPV